MAVESQVRRIEVKIDTNGDRSLKTIAKGFSDVNKSVRDSTKVMSSFRNAFLAIQGLSFAGIGVRELIQAADAMQKLNDRLTITEGNSQKAKEQLGSLTDVANSNYTSIEDMATVYTRLNMALGDTGISSKELTGLTDTLVKTFRLSGATAAEATGATIQLSQGLASGQLRGQELRSVLESNVVIGKLLATQLGVTRGQLIKIASKNGGISAVEVMKALANGMEELNGQAKNLKPTIQEALIANLNNLKLKLLEVNEKFEISNKLIGAMDYLFKNIDVVGAILGMVAAYKAFTTAVTLATGAQLLFNTTILKFVASPIIGFLAKVAIGAGALTVGIAGLAVAAIGLVGYWASLDKSMEKTGETTKKNVGFQKSMTEQYQEQKIALAELTRKKREAEVANNQLSRSYVLVDNSINPLDKAFKDTISSMREGTGTLSPLQKAFKDFAFTAKESSSGSFEFKEALAELNDQFTSKSIGLIEYNKRLKELRILDLKKEMKEGAITNEEYNKKLKEIEFGKLKNNVKEFQFDLRGLNKEFGETGSIYFYSKALDDIELGRLSADFREGKINLLDFNSALNAKKLEEYNREFSTGTISLQNYREGIREAKIDELTMKFKAGRIEAAEFNDEMTKLSEKFNPSSALFTGINNYVTSAGTISQNVANVVTQTFGHLEDSMVQFTETGKFNFREFTKAVLDDLNRIIIRSLIIRPLAEGILGSISGGGATAGAPSTYGRASSDYMGREAAKGAAFDGGRANFFASGGVVNGATSFGYGGGKLGIMGEAGPEAILPLKRGANGDLGVKATPSNVVVNVINQSGAETQQTESTNANGDRVIDVLIIGKVKEGFANGSFDRQMSQQYGLRRRGA